MMCLTTIRVHRIHSVLQISHRATDRGINYITLYSEAYRKGSFKYQYYPVWPFSLFDVRKLISDIFN